MKIIFYWKKFSNIIFHWKSLKLFFGKKSPYVIFCLKSLNIMFHWKYYLCFQIRKLLTFSMEHYVWQFYHKLFFSGSFRWNILFKKLKHNVPLKILFMLLIMELINIFNETLCSKNLSQIFFKKVHELNIIFHCQIKILFINKSFWRKRVSLNYPTFCFIEFFMLLVKGNNSLFRWKYY